MPANDDNAQPPDLQEWIERYGGYLNIPWPEWDAANAKYQHGRRAYLGGPISQEDKTVIKRRKRRAAR